MAIAGQDKITWRSRDLAFDLIVFLLQILFDRRRSKLPGDRRRPKVAIDANLVAYKHVGRKSPVMPDAAVAIIARSFSEKGIDVVIYCDHPTERHPSKRASCDRQSKREKAGIKLIKARMELRSVLSTQHLEEKDADSVDNLQKKIRSLENVQNRALPADFIEKVKGFVDNYNVEGGGNITFFSTYSS